MCNDRSDEPAARKLIGVSRQALHRWLRGQPISDADGRRILAVRDVLERAAQRHPTPELLVAWLDTPRGADGRTPAQLLDAGDVDRARLYAVSTPSPRLSRPPAWVTRPVPPAFLAGAEHRQEALPPEDDEAPALADDADEAEQVAVVTFTDP